MQTPTVFRAGAAPVLVALLFAAPPAAAQSIATALRPFVDNHSLAGAVVLVADRDKVLALETAGYADIGAHKPMARDSVFWIASQSKPITAAALMMLVDDGKLKLDDPVEKYLPEFKDQWLAAEQDKDHLLLRKPKQKVIVRHLLSHTSGMLPRSAVEQPTLDLLPLATAVRSYVMTPLQTEPSTAYRYSNAGINTAGRIIEVLSGMTYEEFLDKRLFEPLGMKDTTFWPHEEQLRRLAKSYKPNEKKTGLEETVIIQLKYPLNDRRRQPMPAGGLFSTAGDLVPFCQMMLNRGVYRGRRYLSESAVEEMTRKQTGANIKTGYGLGFTVADGHFGHGGAYSTNMEIDPRTGLITIFMVQHAGFPGNGKESLAAFKKAATELYGAKK